MRRILSVFVMSLLGLAICEPAHGDGMLIPVPESTAPGYLTVLEHHVSVEIEDNHAHTHVEQVFHNPYPATISSRYIFPIPPGMTIDRFEATLGGERQTATHLDAAATEEALQAFLLQQHDPSLLRYAGWESLAFDLVLEPMADQAMILDYEELLKAEGGLYRYRYILSTERYSAHPLEEVSLTLDLHSSTGLAHLYSPSHVLSRQELGPEHVRLAWHAQELLPHQDFDLFYALTPERFAAGLLTGHQNGHDHLFLLLSPRVGAERSTSMPKDIVFVLDRSGSMSGAKIDQARGALHYILDRLDDQDRFSIVSFDHRVSVFSNTLIVPEPDVLDDARHYVTNLSADGDTDLDAALQQGLQIFGRSKARGAARMMIFLTDGLPTAGITDEHLIAGAVARTNAPLETRLHVFGVGYDVNTHLLDRLAAEQGGTVTYVQPNESLEQVLTQFYGKIAQPMLTNVQLDIDGLKIDNAYPRYLPDLYAGSSLLLSGRYRATSQNVTIRLLGWSGDERQEFAYEIDLNTLTDHDFVPRLWATRHVGSLLDRIRISGESQSLRHEIADLGLRYGIVTPYTTFVVDGQTSGAASVENMALYDSEGLGLASGRVTIQARVQNQAYQEATQASLATGANIQAIGKQALAQVGTQNLDLSLLEGQIPSGPLSADWIARNIPVDRTVQFGTEEYLSLAKQPDVRPFLESGPNVIFAYEGQVIAVQDTGSIQSLDGNLAIDPDKTLAPGITSDHNDLDQIEQPSVAREDYGSQKVLLAAVALVRGVAVGGFISVLVFGAWMIKSRI